MGKLKPRWKRLKLGELVRQVKDKVTEPASAGITHYVPGGGLSQDDLRIREWQPVDDGVMGPAFHMRFREGHTLYKSRVPHGVAVADRSGICANTTFVLEPADDRLLPELLPYVLSTDDFRQFEKNNDHGSTNLFLNFSDIVAYEFALPPLEEQRRIVTALEHLRVAADSLLDLRSSADSVITAVRDRMLTASWLAGKRASLQSIALGKYGMVDGPFGSNLKSVHFRSSGHPVISSSMFSTGKFSPGEDDYRFVDSEKFAQLARNRAVGGDILIVLIGFNCGTAAILPDDHEPGVITQNCLKITVDPHIARRDFVLETIRWLKDTGRLERLVTTTQQRALSLGRLRTANIPLPSLDVQDEITCNLREIDEVAHCASVRGNELRAMARQVLRSMCSQ